MTPSRAFEYSTWLRNEDYIVRDHRVHGVRLMPGVVFLDLVFRALAARRVDTREVELGQVLFVEPVATSGEFDRQIRLRFTPEGGRWHVVGESRPVQGEQPLCAEYTENFRCEVYPGLPPLGGWMDVDAVRARARRVMDLDEAYAYARNAHIEHYAFMKGLGRLYLGDAELLAEVHLSGLAQEYLEDLPLHPAYLDSSTLLPFMYLQESPDTVHQPFIPIHLDGFRAAGALGDRVIIHVRRASTGLVSGDIFHSDIDLYSPGGEHLAQLRKLSTKRIRSEALISRLRHARALPPSAPGALPSPTGAAPLPAPSGAPAADGLLEHLRRLISAEIDVPAADIRADADFYSQGLDSSHLLHLVQTLERVLDVKLYPTLLFEHGTPGELAAHLRQAHSAPVQRLMERTSGEQGTPPPRDSRAPEQDMRPAPPPAPRSAPRPLPSRFDLPEPVAVIGVAGRYPMAGDLDAFWDNLKAGRDCITPIPSERWHHERWFHPDPDHSGTSYGRWGGFLDGVDQFDPRMFNLSPREAELMDPQERLFLETAWHTLEDAGYAGRALARRRVGVFVGVMWGQYELLGVEETLAGNPVSPMSFPSSIANRLSYFFDLRGPSLAVDTMCSSSLTALHLACESLHRAECELALVGGVNLMLHPSKYLFLSENRMLSTDGRCRAFGKGGSGYVPGEGVGAVLLKPLSRAEADGDFVHGVIRATAVNHGGRANGYTVPDPDAQAGVISEALARSGVDPSALGYIEAHGTGTSLGDPIEVSGLGKALAGWVPQGWTCAVGSVKSNIGHLEACAGIAGLTKVLLQLRHRQLVPTLHTGELNPYIDFTATPLRVQTALSPWPAPLSGSGSPAPRLAGLSSFGAGGANAHVLIEEYVPPPAPASLPRPHLAVLSARKEEQLAVCAERLLRALERQSSASYTGPRATLEQLAFTLQTRGEAMAARLALVASSVEELRGQLGRYLEGRSRPGEPLQGVVPAGRTPSAAQVPPGTPDAAVLRALAAQWVEGAELDFRALHPEPLPRRFPLPGYPFERRRYWLSAERKTSAGPGPRLHPLLGRNTSTLRAVRFSTTFTPGDALLSDHRVGGRPTLPGVAILEMALASARLAGAPEVRVVRGLTWARPVSLPPAPAALEIVAELRPDEDGLAFTLADADGALYAQGRLSASAPQAPAPGPPLAELRQRCARAMSPEECYRLLSLQGLEYGDGLRALTALHLGTDEALAALRLPPSASAEGFTLPPALVDGALQAVVGLLSEGPGVPARSWLPFSLGTVALSGPLPAECLAHVRRTSSGCHRATFDIHLRGPQGEVLLVMEELVLREAEPPGSTGLRVLGEAWVPEARSASPAGQGPLLLFSPDPALASAVRSRHPGPVVQVLPGTGFASSGPDTYRVAMGHGGDLDQLLQALKQQGRLPTAILHCGAKPLPAALDERALQDVLDSGLHTLLHLGRAWMGLRPVPRLTLLWVWPGDEVEAPLHAAMSGFCRTARREHPHLDFRAVALADASVHAPEVAAQLLLGELSAAGGDDPIRYSREGRSRLRRTMVTLPGPVGPPVLRARGVYLITGGRGALGQHVAELLARRFQARLVLVGRAPEDAPVRERLRALEAHRAQALYLQADVSRRADVEALIQGIVSRFGTLHGVIHSAGVVRDSLIPAKRLEDVAEVLRPKVHGTLLLDEATRDLPLDCFVLFSSLAAITGNPGQCDYAFANRFLDHFAQARASQVQAGRRRGRSLSIAWPLWREGGMGVDTRTLQHLGQTLGMAPLGTEAALDFLLRALCAPEPFLGVVEGDVAAIDRAFQPIPPAPHPPQVPPPAARAETSGASEEQVTAAVRELLSIPPEEVDLDLPLEDFGFTPVSLASLCARLGERSGADLKPSDLIQYPTLRALARALPAAPVAPAPLAPRPAPVAVPPAPEGQKPPAADALRARVQSRVLQLAASILKMDLADVDPTAELRDFGFDSISMTRLATSLQESLGASITAAMLFEYDSLGALVSFLVQTQAEFLRARLPEPHAAPEPPVPEGPSTSLPPATPAPANSPTAGAPVPLHAAPRAQRAAPATAEPIAIIGRSGRFPGSPDLATFWRHLEAGADLISEIPPERWDWRALYGDALSTPGRTHVKWGSFMDGVDHFDAAFFRITPKEAALMDPQHRLFLQVAWHTLEDAGYRPSSLAGSRTAVFVGVGTTDYHDLLRDFGVATEAQTATGKAHSVLPNRLSFLLDLHGPSFPVETACSSSLVALHQAVQALRSGQCDLALVGGVNLLLDPHLYFSFSRAGMLSPDGRCKTFDARASGYSRGEGAGAVLLKPLSRAEEDGDSIYAVIRGVAVNHGGRASALTAPNPNSQAALLLAAYREAGVDPSTVGYIEAHGTGTRLGDPIEINALQKAFQGLYQERGLPAPASPHCGVGSVKTNIGHLETAAGIAGLLKVLLSFEHRTLPASIHFETCNPEIRLEGSPFYVQARTGPWTAPTDASGAVLPRRAGVSSFGFGGTNAHVVLEEYQASPPPPAGPRRGHLVALSARDASALREAVVQLHQSLRRATPPPLDEVAYTLAVGRDVYEARLATVVESLPQLLERLESWVAQGSAAGVHTGTSGRTQSPALLVRGAAGNAFLQALAANDELDSLARLWVDGADVELTLPYRDSRPRRVSLPGYPFARTRHWLLPGPAHLALASRAASPDGPAVPEQPRDRPPEPAPAGEASAVRADLHALTVRALAAAFAETAGMDPTALAPSADFEGYGMNSVLIAELSQRLEADFGRIPITTFFKYKNLADLAAWLIEDRGDAVQRMLRTQAPPPPPAPARSAAPARPKPGPAAERTDIAIIGMAGRYPMAGDLHHFWQNLLRGRDCIVEIPGERWDYRPFFDPTRQSAGSIYSKWGGFLDGVDRFDAAFFQLSPLIARYMDPQERLFLETAWACLEDAGHSRATLAWQGAGDHRGPVGVYVGVTYNEYAILGAQQWANGNPVPFNTQTFSIANRVSYALNLSGPSLTVDTACSSSLHALHLACEALRSGACELALAGGVNLSLHPNKYLMLCANRFASTDGRCRSFGEGGDGYVPGEGVGAVLLKPLSRAIEDGDAVYAVIKGSAVNHDGRTHGYTVPNPVAQTEVILTALERAGVDARTVSYVEAHGTGTSLGDPIEVTGLTDAFGRYTRDRGFCALGSVKSNIGHLESAAGIAQLHKVVLQMQHHIRVPNLLHSPRTNPHIDFDSTPFYLQREVGPWEPRAGEPLRACISSFGAGGVNVHMVVESFQLEPVAAAQPPRPVLMVLSARTPEQLRTRARQLLDFLEARPGLDAHALEDVGYTLQVGREPLAARLAFVAVDPAECRQQLRAYVEADASAGSPEARGLFVGTPSRAHREAPRSEELRRLAEQGAFEEVARAWVEGTCWPWEELHRGRTPRRVHLPTYPFAGERYWLEAVSLPASAAPTAAPQAPAAPPVRERLSEAPPAERASMLESYVQEVVARILAYPPPSLPEVEAGFFDMGMESVQSTQLIQQVEQELSVELYPTAAFDHPTIRAMARYLGEKLPPISAPQSSAAGHTVAREEAPRAEKVLARQVWRTSALQDPAAGAPRGVLLVGGGAAAARAFREVLGEQVPVVVARPGQRWNGSAEEPALDVSDAGQVGELLAALGKRGLQVSHVFDLEDLENGAGGPPTAAFERLLSLAQGLLASAGQGPVHLGYVYKREEGLHPPRHAAVAGFARALRLETPRVRCQTLALEVPAPDLRQVARWALVNAASDDVEVRYINDTRQVRALVEAASGPGGTSLFRQAGAYLITGGAGGLGLTVAAYLAATVQARVALVGRSALEGERRQQVERLRARGIDIRYLRGDMASREDAFRVVEEAARDLGALHGIIHAAGVTRDALVTVKTRRQAAEVIGPKVQGTLHLDEASRALPLELFALFSSTAGVTGNVGQTDYAFANAFLDAFAAEREALRARGQRHGRTVSFSWPLWAEGGMRVDEQTKRFMERRGGLLPLPTREGLAEFERGLADSAPHRVLFYGHRATVLERLGISTARVEDDAAVPAPMPAPARSAPARAPSAGADASTGAIALIGMACRFPGGCDSPESFWDFLLAGGDAITDVPPERWDVPSFFSPDADVPGTSYVRKGGFLRTSPALFDARFFGISPREAAEMDPQQRLLLEVAWEALERAGLPPKGLEGSRSGVFIGLTGSEYALLPRTAAQFGAYTATGVAPNIASGRIAHVLGLQGPALTVDTACSSSLMAVHLACESLRRGESDLALAGGVNLLLSPHTFISLSRMRALAPDGRCKTFDASGDGYGRGEGCGVIVLKRLEDALHDADTVLAVIRGSAANHDGISGGLTVPNGLAQQALLQKALAAARLSPHQVSYVEAHGTGTPLGDPIEMQAIGAVYGERREEHGPITVGAVKANLGHLEAAAGIAGLIKTVLCLQHGTLPGQLHLRKLNPRISLEKMNGRIPREAIPWTQGPRFAGVSAFGFSGTNVHVLLGEPPAPAAPRPTAARPGYLLALSALEAPALRALATAWHRHLSTGDDAQLAAACATSLTGRTHHRLRAALVAPDRASLLAGLEALAAGSPHPTLVEGNVGPPPAFVLAFPHAADLRSVADALCPVLPELAAAYEASRAKALSLLEQDASGPVRDAVAAWCAQSALVQLLLGWGYSPETLVANGAGLPAAAHVAGALDEEDGLRLMLRDLGVRPAEDGPLPKPRAPRMRLLSARPGESWSARPPLDSSTWASPRRPSGDWDSALAGLASARSAVMVLGDAPASPPEAARERLFALQGPRAWEALLRCVAGLYTLGLVPDRHRFMRDAPRPARLAPTYPFQRTHHWLSPAREEGPPGSAFEGTLIASPRAGVELAYRLSHARLPDLADNHGVLHIGHHQELIARALQGQLGTRTYALGQVRFPVALRIAPGEERDLRLVLEPAGGGTRSLELHSREAASGPWHLHVRAALERPEPSPGGGAGLPVLGEATTWDGPTFYRRLAGLSFVLGESVRWVEEVRSRPGEAVARFRSDAPAGDAGLGFHPGILDACAQLFAVAGEAWLPERTRFMVVGWDRFTFHGPPGRRPLWGHVTFPAPPAADGTVIGTMRLLDDTGAVVAEARSHRLRLLSPDHVQALEEALAGREARADSPPARPPGPMPHARRPWVVEWLRERAAQRLGLKPSRLPTDVSLRDLGLDSIISLELRRDIEEGLSVRVRAETLLEGPSVEALATSLLGDLAEGSPRDVPSDVPSEDSPGPWFAHVVRRARPTLRLFCFPYGGGGASLYRGWELLPGHIEVWPVQLPGREGRIHEPPLSRVEALLEELQAALAPRLDLPFAFYGHSMGALVAFLLAGRLRTRGLPLPSHLWVGGFPAPSEAPGPYLRSLQARLAEAGLTGIPEPGSAFPVGPLLDVLLSTDEGRALAGRDTELAQALLPMMLADLKLVEGYRHLPVEPFPFPITACHGTLDDRVSRAAMERWREHTASTFRLQVLAGDHFFLRKSQAQDELLSLLSAALSAP